MDRLHGFYGDSYTFKIERKTPNGTKVFMSLPLKKKESIFEGLVTGKEQY